MSRNRSQFVIAYKDLVDGNISQGKVISSGYRKLESAKHTFRNLLQHNPQISLLEVGIFQNGVFLKQ